MISFNRDGTKVMITVSLTVPYYEDRVFFFYWEAGSAWAAGLLAHAMNEAFTHMVRMTREQEYDAGWAAAKKKTKKETWFRGYI
jgi:hypothetical protein